MTLVPKLRIILPTDKPSEEFCELEQAKYRFNFDDGVIMVEGQTVHSYDELVEIAIQDKYRNKEFLDVVLLQVIEGG